ncbi:hypothetical protein BDA96_06G111700 [Sorghum bicolor]|uniref:Uncharacterized protein n=1 Tax=Sorghum bicolor TaxID=4558 RepID=A0A921QQ80_SORBI|nr:hypothetical protein BDA96_06G111700 [Sorghum bicolor]
MGAQIMQVPGNRCWSWFRWILGFMVQGEAGGRPARVMSVFAVNNIYYTIL